MLIGTMIVLTWYLFRPLHFKQSTIMLTSLLNLRVDQKLKVRLYKINKNQFML